MARKPQVPFLLFLGKKEAKRGKQKYDCKNKHSIYGNFLIQESYVIPINVINKASLQEIFFQRLSITEALKSSIEVASVTEVD